MDKSIITNPILKNNPVTVLVLGICSALAVTVKLEPACVMAISVTAVTGFASFIASLLRNTIPNRIRIIVHLVTNRFLHLLTVWQTVPVTVLSLLPLHLSESLLVQELCLVSKLSLKAGIWQTADGT